MSVSDGEKRRVVVPRWRSLTSTPSVETVPTVRFPEMQGTTVAQFRSLVSGWRTSGKPEDYVDILDAGIAAGSRPLAVEGARYILRNSSQFRPLVLARARVVISGKPGYVAEATIEGLSPEDTYKKISRLRVDLLQSPRNPLAHVEMARLYSRLAQIDSAAKHIAIATSLAPNDRFVLRAMTRFYTMVGTPDEALKLLWQASALGADPWLQSAELAAAMIARKGTKKAHRTADKLVLKGRITRDLSELAAGWATKLDLGGASQKKILRAISPTLSEPTENALAQSVWLTDRVGKEFIKTFPNVILPNDAHEAKCLAWTEEGRFEEAEAEAVLWVADQPFQARSFVLLAFLRSVHLNDHEGALAAAIQGLVLHDNDWALLNLAVISAAFLSQFPLADELLIRLEKVADEDYAKSFHLAATGLIHFVKGRFREGFSAYLETIRFCRQKNLRTLSVNAAIYLVENLCRHSLINASDAVSFTAEITKQINRLSASEARDELQILVSRQKVWSEFFDGDNGNVDLMQKIRTDEFEAMMREEELT